MIVLKGEVNSIENVTLTNERLIQQLSNNISNTRNSVSSEYPSTEKRVENATHSGVFLAKFEVFGQLMKHLLECLVYLLNQNKIYTC